MIKWFYQKQIIKEKIMLLNKFYTRMKGILSFVHKKRLDSLLTVSETLVTSGKLGIATLGNNIINNTTPKHNIKKVDRLIGNQKLEVKKIYSALSRSCYLVWMS